jgi:hypothetical protein
VESTLDLGSSIDGLSLQHDRYVCAYEPHHFEREAEG